VAVCRYLLYGVAWPESCGGLDQECTEVPNRIRDVVVFAVVAAAAAVVIFLSLRQERAGPPPGVDGQTPQQPVPGGRRDAGPDALRRARAPVTREALLAFLAAQVAPPSDAGAATVWPPPEFQREVLEALAAADPQDGAARLLAVLAGDGDAASWPALRLHAAWLRAEAGQEDGAATVTAWLQAYPVPSDGEGAGPAAQVAASMGAGAGSAAVRQMLAAPLDSYDEDDLAAILQAVATLGEGASVETLRAILAAGPDVWAITVLGAAAGALKRLGDDSGQGIVSQVAADDWFEGEELALGLAARGNSAVLPWLYQALRCEDGAARAQAARSLRVVGDKAAMTALRPALEDSSADVAAEAAMALLALGDETVLPRVRAAVGCPAPETASAAWRLLALRGDAASVGAAQALWATPPPEDKGVRRSIVLRPYVWAAALLLRAGPQ
jgi:hypothetical protein